MKQAEAYSMMFAFLEDRYFRCPTDELGALLGALSVSQDGRPMDPALAEDWDDAVERVTREREAQALNSLRKAS